MPRKIEPKTPMNTPLNEWSRGWLVMEVASLLDVPDYIGLSDVAKRAAGYPETEEEMRQFISDRRDADAEIAR